MINLDEVKIGDEIIYHTGVLAHDRWTDNPLNLLAEELLTRSTGQRRAVLLTTPLYGTGEFELYQRPIKVREATTKKIDGMKLDIIRMKKVWQYCARRIKAA